MKESELTHTLAWAKKHDLKPVLELVRSLAPHPLIVVGSGGSVTAGDFLVRLHQSFARLPAVVLTPYEFMLRQSDEVSGVVLLSAGGGNPDIVNAARHASEASYPVVSVIVGRTGSPLASRMRDCRHAQRVELDLPVTDDPLGMNSLLATVTLLSRAYGSVFNGDGVEVEMPALPKEVDSPELDRAAFSVLAAGWSFPAAHHFASECNEAGLGTALLTDYRNFAHGGHNMLARRGSETTVVAFVNPDCRAVAAATLELLPKSSPTVVIETAKEGSSGAIELLLLATELVERISARPEGDRGQRPVTAFGKSLYHMDISGHDRIAPRETRRRERIDHWIQRKVGGAAWASATDDERDAWRSEYEKWASLQRATSVGGIVFDYDGTICEADERYSRPGAAIAAALTRLLDLGLALGVASGRGRSVVDALRALLPEEHWQQVAVGPYNGSLVMSLADPFPERQPPADLMRDTRRILEASTLIDALAKVSFAGTLQVTLVEKRPLPAGMLRRIVLETLLGEPHLLDEVFVQSSGLTIDVIGRDASKRRVVDHVGAQTGSESSPDRKVFAIGDQGSLDGNDFALLSGSHSLSVHKVSSLFDQCWNVARPGRRGSVAFIDYLDAVVPREAGGNVLAFDLDSLESA